VTLRGFLQGLEDEATTVTARAGVTFSRLLSSSWSWLLNPSSSTELTLFMAILSSLAQRLLPPFRCQRVRLISIQCNSPTISDLPLAFRSINPLEGQDFRLADINMREPTRHVYSRYTQQVSTRLEHILSRINASDNCHCCHVRPLTSSARMVLRLVIHLVSLLLTL